MTARFPSLLGSLRGRLTLAIGVTVALALIVIALSASRLFAGHVERQFHEELEVHLQELTRLVEVTADGDIHLIRRLSDPRFEEQRSGFYWQVTSGSHRLRSSSLASIGPDAALDTSLATGPAPRHDLLPGPTGTSETYGLMHRGPNGAPVLFVVGTDQRFLEIIRHQFDHELQILLAGFALLFTAAMWAAIRFSLAPLDRITAAVEAVRHGKVDRIDGEFPLEVRALVDSLNAWMHETRDLVDRGRREAGQLAHSLRTPLAVVQDEAERIAAADRRSGGVLIDQVSAMRAQIDWHLARSRGGADSRITGLSTQLPAAIVPLIHAFERLHPDRRIILTIDVALTPQCDPADFQEILGNLIDNAMRHARGPVHVSTQAAGHRALVRVDSEDASDLPDDPEDCFAVGFSGEQRSSGLGLAIARDLAGRHGGTLRLERCAAHRACVSAVLDLPDAAR